MNTQIKKHPQTILGFFSNYFTGRFEDGLTEYPYEQFLQEVQGAHVLAEREMLEKFPLVRQALPCAAIRQQRENGDWQYYVFQRTSKVGESRLAGMVACFWGGHVDAVDAVFNQKSVLDLGQTLLVGRDREQGEEYRIYKVDSPFDNDLSLKFPLLPANQFIANSTVEVDKHHVAIIYTIDVPVGHSVEVLEEELIGMAPMTAQEALDAHEAGTIQLESWALIYFKHVRAQELLDSGAKVAIEPMVENTEGQDIRDSLGTIVHVAEKVAHVRAIGDASDADRAQGFSWLVELSYKDASDAVAKWHHGPYYDAYVAAGGKNWDEFAWKVGTLFGDPVEVLTAPKDAIAADLYPAQAQIYPMLFASKDGQHTVEQMLALLDLVTKKDFEMKVFIHQDLERGTMKPVGSPYQFVEGKKVPYETMPSAVAVGNAIAFEDGQMVTEREKELRRAVENEIAHAEINEHRLPAAPHQAEGDVAVRVDSLRAALDRK